MADAPVTHLLVLSRENACRSQMAEAWLRYFGGDRVQVASAGIDPGALRQAAVAAMEEAGVDLSGHYPKGLDEVELSRIEHVITVGDETSDPGGAFPDGVSRVHWAVPDPSELGREFPALVTTGFRAVRDNVRDRAFLFLKRLGVTPAPLPGEAR